MEQEVFVHAYEVVRPIVLKASRQYFIQLWDQADMEQEAMMTLYQLLKKFPELASDDDKLRRYFKTKFRNRLNDEVRRQESVKRQANRQCYIEISDIAFCLPNKELDAVDRLVYCAAPLEASADDGYISFIYIARKACRRIAVQGADNNARCAFVEPADAAEHCALPLALQMPGDCVCERVALMVMGRVHREKG